MFHFEPSEPRIRPGGGRGKFGYHSEKFSILKRPNVKVEGCKSRISIAQHRRETALQDGSVLAKKGRYIPQII